ncbi:DAR GTPase 2, mitochondrial isoform X1 [Brassica napus]|uniref:CP-type G domain-containing protein n=2 Tax=Brassica TaxID=3705 RepID=A0A0D3E904_BRAOL|nr:PREDICTED: DAR GTPase 2, mitochondrial [Brassica oleracea var. oleracea]XP_013749247.1 DAR GTPase 2, mitochondrial isoform X1 [Brassica napus]KAG2275968.1 hypothetical protein Bca52824_058523 [Brassica carinata]
MTTAKSWKIGREIGDAVVKASSNPNRRWYGPHMAASVRAISERIPLVDFVLEIRDARTPLSSEYELLRKFSPFSSTRIVVLNKMELADPLELKKWMAYFQGRNYLSYAVNSHNKECVKNFLNFLQSQVRELHKSGHSGHTTTMMLLGVPNVGKSALANSLHQIGRISAAEKGKLKHTTVSSQPGDTKDIMSLKIGSHPNVYVLDTPGVFPPKLLDAEICSKLALAGAIPDDIIGETELARFCLTLLNSSHEYKKWAKLCKSQDVTGSLSNESSTSSAQRKRQYPTDHTQDFIVYDVRRVLYETISVFNGNLEDDISMGELVETQFAALRTVLRVTEEASEFADLRVASKILNLYRTGRLGHYTLEHASC